MPKERRVEESETEFLSPVQKIHLGDLWLADTQVH